MNFNDESDNGEELNPNLISKPDMCTTYRKDEDENEEIVCNLNRLDQACDKEFICYAYESRFEEERENDEEKERRREI